LHLAGIVAAMVLAALVNVLSARHFSRWDWTKSRRWSLSAATVETLRTLERSVDVWAIAGPAEPLEQSLRQILPEYQATSPHVVVHWIDPDRDAVQLLDLERRFGIEAGRAEDGRVATDAIVVVSSGDRHWFLSAKDMFEQTDDLHVKPREERQLTQAILAVLGTNKAKLCFTVGHGEMSIDSAKDERESLGALRDLLEKNNYDLESVDSTVKGAQDPFAGCDAVVVAGPRSPFPADEANRLRSWLLQGGNLFAAIGPLEAPTSTGMAGAGLEAVLEPFGIALDDDLVHEPDAAVAIPDTHGEAFFVSARTHPVTAGLVAGSGDAHPPRVALFFSRSLRHVSASGTASSSDLLVTGDGAYAKKSIVGASTWTDAPAREVSDEGGPLVLAMASERPRLGASAPHGPRVVVVGSRFALAEDNWRQPRALHGAAFLVDGALSWLVARPPVVDVPDKVEVVAGMRISEQGRDEVRRYVLVIMPLAAILLGAAVWAWRRSSENKPYVPGGAGEKAGEGSR
jgi:hypothetical protein